MIQIKTAIYLSLLTAVGYTCSADNNPLVRVLREWNEQQAQQEARETTFLQDFNEGLELVANRTTESARILARELATPQGAERILLKPLALGVIDGCIIGVKNYTTKEFYANDKKILAAGCASLLITGRMCGTLNQNTLTKMITYDRFSSLRDFALNDLRPSFLPNLLIRTTLSYPQTSLETRLRNIYTENQLHDNEFIGFALPLVASLAGNYVGSKATEAALEYIKANELAHTAFEKTLQGAIAVAEQVKPAVESCCSIQ